MTTVPAWALRVPGVIAADWGMVVPCGRGALRIHRATQRWLVLILGGEHRCDIRPYRLIEDDVRAVTGHRDGRAVRRIIRERAAAPWLVWSRLCPDGVLNYHMDCAQNIWAPAAAETYRREVMRHALAGSVPVEHAISDAAMCVEITQQEVVT